MPEREIVNGVVGDYKAELMATKTSAEKIATYLKKDWEKIKKSIA